MGSTLSLARWVFLGALTLPACGGVRYAGVASVVPIPPLQDDYSPKLRPGKRACATLEAPAAVASARLPTPRVEVTTDRIAIDQEILFDTDKATIDAASNELLRAILAVLRSHPEIDFVEIAGHADKRGDAGANVALTQARADAVLEWLASGGVDRARLRAVGYGPYCPLDPADSEAAYAKNRRVELRILRRAGVDQAAWGGCDAALRHGLAPRPLPAKPQGGAR